MRAETDSSNWIDGPHNRWGFLHVRELTRTARIGGSPTGLAPLARGDDDIRSFTFDHLGRRWRFDEMLQATFTDGVMVVVDDVVIFEHYSGCMQPSDTHLLMSVSKSLTSTLAGVLAGQGLIDLTAFVPDYIGQLRGTAWDGCTLQHLLDMRAGTRFDEDNYDDPNSHGRLIEQISGYTGALRNDLPANTYQWIAELDNAAEHGGRFQYRSILPDVLAWAMCEATGQTFAE
ncbi:MAG TPA: serine hydrolase, partial [Ilumatobacteraceae bacterium]